ncbi:MAG: DUF1579 domain-containing protein [Phycisphaerales bacterium]|nr:DUF1579 domain-containing protein [Phycisphaerales bacterium]
MKKSNQRLLGSALRHLVVAVALVGITAVVTSQVVSEEKDPMGKLKEFAGMDMEAMAKMWKEKNAPGEHHRHLQAMVGYWNAECKATWMPGQPAQISKGTMKVTSLYNGRFIKEEYKGTMNGEPFEGVGYIGYNNASKTYTSAWLDSMATGIMTEQGNCDQSGKEFTFGGEQVCPMDGTDKKTKSIIRIINKDKYEFEMHGQGPDGKMFKSLHIVYTRK